MFSLLTDHLPLPHFSFIGGKTIQERQYWGFAEPCLLFPPGTSLPFHTYPEPAAPLRDRVKNEIPRRKWRLVTAILLLLHSSGGSLKWNLSEGALENTWWACGYHRIIGYFCSNIFLLFIWRLVREPQKVRDILPVPWAAHILFILQ